MDWERSRCIKNDIIFTTTGVSESAGRVKLTARQFSWTVDEPIELGGDDEAANPVEQLLGAFIGCLNVVAHIVAQEQGLEIRRLEFTAIGPIDPARLFGAPTSERAGFQSIRVQISADTDAGPGQLRRWLAEVERRCPVCDNLQNPTEVALQVPLPQKA